MRQYLIINLADTDKIIFSQVNQTSAQSMQRNNDNTQGIISYSIEPSFITNENLTPVQGPLSKEEIEPILKGADWEINY
jgi:hypothetical protein